MELGITESGEDMTISSFKKTLAFLISAASFAAMAAGCSDSSSSALRESSSSAVEETTQEDTTSSDKEYSSSEIEAETLSNKKTAVSDLFSSRDLNPDYSEITASIKLNGDSAEIDGDGAKADGSVITISKEGVYYITGTLNDGQIIVNADKAKVQLVLDNADITCKTSAPVYGVDSDKIFITLAEGSENTLTDAESYTYAEDSAAEPDACIFSFDSLTINGSGKLTVNANYKDGIKSNDDVVITDGDITINSAANGIKGKDYVAVCDGNINITSGTDGIKSSNSEDEGMGFVYIEGGSFVINAGNDGIQAETELIIADGKFDIISGGGSENSTKVHTDDMMGGGMMGGQGGGFGRRGEDFGSENFSSENMTPSDGSFPFGNDQSADTASFTQLAFTQLTETETDDETSTSTKGLKGGASVEINGGTISVDSADDAVHSNGTLAICGGNLTLTSGDDGLNADTDVTVSGGEVYITKSYEGIEAGTINITGGLVDVTSSDDGFNASDGTPQGAMGNFSSGVVLNISGGIVYVDAGGDGLDSNGKMTISGGTVIVNGPTNSGNSALDSNGGIEVTGGVIVAAGMSGMAEYPDSSSAQNSVSCTFDSTLAGGTMVTVTDSEGKEILSFTPNKNYNNIVISTPDLKTGETYTIYTGGTSSSDEKYGLYVTGGYNSDGTEAGSFTVDSAISFIGTQSMMGGGGMMGGHGGGFGGEFGTGEEFDPETMTPPDGFGGGGMTPPGGFGGF